MIMMWITTIHTHDENMHIKLCCLGINKLPFSTWTQTYMRPGSQNYELFTCIVYMRKSAAYVKNRFHVCFIFLQLQSIIHYIVSLDDNTSYSQIILL